MVRRADRGALGRSGRQLGCKSRIISKAVLFAQPAGFDYGKRQFKLELTVESYLTVRAPRHLVLSPPLR